MPARPLKYRAFISYRRKDAGTQARWLRRRLLNFRLPKEVLDDLPEDRRVDAERRVAYFLDTSYQSANEDFWASNIEPALKDSEYLIVLSSPSALETRPDGSENWVAREIASFLAVHGEAEGRKRIIVALTPKGSTEVFPGSLNQLSGNWDWADLRDNPGWRLFAPRIAKRLDDAFLKIAARLFEIPQQLLPVLYREEARQRRVRHACHRGRIDCRCRLSASGVAAPGIGRAGQQVSPASGQWRPGRGFANRAAGQGPIGYSGCQRGTAPGRSRHR